MREAHLARTRHVTAADETRFARRVMRRAKRTNAHERTLRTEHAGDAVDRRDLERLGRRERRKDARQTAREHRFSRARWPDEEKVVSAGRTDLERTPRRGLTAHIGEIIEHV